VLDARHTCDKQWWLTILPAFHEVGKRSQWRKQRSEILFAPDIAIAQVAQVFARVTIETDKVDMRNMALYHGQALYRDRCDGMTSVGTGVTYSLTTTKGLQCFFNGEVIIEDTSSSHDFFMDGKRSVYLPPKASNRRQYSLGIAKRDENYVEGLERWHIGAVQILVTQGLPRCWFWVILLLQALWVAAACIPTMLGPANILEIFGYGGVVYLAKNPWHTAILYASLAYLVSPFVVLPIVSCCSPATFNYLLRFWIIYENCTYPFWGLVSSIWLIVPPWVCFTGRFPFPLNGVVAIVGTAVIRVAEYAVVMNMQREAEARGVAQLDESDILLGQQMYLVQIPIYVRAIWKGFSSAWSSARHKADNSFWESFVKSPVTFWCAMWMAFIVIVMISSLVAGVVIVVRAGLDKGWEGVQRVAIPEGYGMAMAATWIWVSRKPLLHMMKDNVPSISGRHVDTFLLMCMFAVTLLAYPASKASNTLFNWSS